MLQQRPQLSFESPPSLDTARHALFLDLDGTLVEIATHPQQVIASDELRALLTDLSRAMDGAVALITGRTIASADAVLDGALLHIAGVHGLESRADAAQRNGDTSAIAAAKAEALRMVEKGALDVDIEDKHVALALHYRRTPKTAATVRRVAGELAHRHGLSVVEGKMVVELKLGQRNKGDAIADFMTGAPFAGRTPIAIGDDITDEDAFVAVEAMNGVAILVGPPRPSAARRRLEGTPAVMAWLAEGLRT